MLFYQFLNKLKKVSNANYMTGFLINFTYIMLMIPSIYFRESGLFSRYYFFLLIIFYSAAYYYLSNLKKHENI